MQRDPAPPPASKPQNHVLPFLILGILVLAALALGGYIAFKFQPGATQADMGQISLLSKILAGVLVAALGYFAFLTSSITGRLKKGDETTEVQAREIESTKATLDKTKGDLDFTKNQLSNTVFQLQNANVQFDIITGELDAAKRETDSIFATVRQGLFLLGPDGTIGAQASEELKNIFQTRELAKRNFAQVLRPLLPEKKFQTISDYFDLLFDPRKNEKQLQKFNPLKRVELNFPRPEGGFQAKHIEFSFQRIVNNGAVSRVLVTALDISERIKLEDKLREGEVLRERQLGLLFEILQVDGTHLRDFIDESKGAMEKINNIFMEQSSEGNGTAVLQDKVQRVFRIAHNLKSQAASLNLHLFEKAIHQVEDQLNELRRNPNLVNEDLLNVLVSISNYQTQLQEAGELIEKVAGLRRSFESGNEEMLGTPSPPKPSEEMMKVVNDLCAKVMERTGKKAHIDWKLGRSYDELPQKQRKLLQNALFQLVRNSVVHGIEAPDARKEAGKDPTGKIRITLSPIVGKKQVLLLCRDDGAGLNAEAIRARALREKMIEESTVLSENDLYALIFEPGFSTVNEANEDGGRGVGLDVIRAEIVDELNGEIQIGFAPGRFCEFGIIVPSV